MSLVVTIYRRIYWAPKDYIHILWLLCIHLVLIFFYSYLYERYVCAYPWLMMMTMMTSNDSHISHDERLLLTIYSLYILRHTEHQTTTSIFILLIFYCEPQVTVHVSGEFYDWLSDWLTDHGARDISGDHLIFLLIEHQMTHMSTTTNALSTLYIHHIF